MGLRITAMLWLALISTGGSAQDLPSPATLANLRSAPDAIDELYRRTAAINPRAAGRSCGLQILARLADWQTQADNSAGVLSESELTFLRQNFSGLKELGPAQADEVYYQFLRLRDDLVPIAAKLR